MSQSSILREYLIKLGYKVDESASRKFDLDVLTKQRSVTRLGASVVGLGTAVTVLAGRWARSMEQLYYSSIKAESAAGKIKALEFGGKQIGISAETMRAAVESMARSLRMNPGLQGLLESLGVRVQGRDRADVLADMVASLRKMPFYVASQYANLFGLDPDTLLLLEQGLDKMKQVQRQREEMAAQAGLDYAAVAEAGKEYAKDLNEIWEKVGLVKDAAMVALLPAFREVAGVVKQVLDDWVKIAKDFGKPADIVQRLKEGLTGKTGGGVVLSAESKARLGMPIYIGNSRAGAGRGFVNPPLVGAPKTQAEALFKGLEQTFGLPDGILDKVWKKESNRGRNMLSPAGAKGHFQFMDATAAQYGVADPNDLSQSATGAARYLSDLLKKYKGNLGMALAAYNWGPGNVDRKGLGAAPLETRDYVKEITGAPISVENNVVVYGANDPVATGNSVGGAVEKSTTSALRNTMGVYR